MFSKTNVNALTKTNEFEFGLNFRLEQVRELSYMTLP